MESQKEMRIGELSTLTGVKIETIRYYEKSGIMPDPPRTEAGYRMYREEHLNRLNFICRCRQLGFPMRDIGNLLELVDEHDYTCADVRDLTLGHAENVREKIADLRRLEKALRSIAARCTGSKVPECPIVDALLEPE
ncbi:MAG: helix-turn-helix domain-containing protein [Woeseia sp.]|nr:helix-turn-helix domain-containing protein [Gammaproteobacteria bacterium]NNE62406.1 helix-turn-helix domain-containing protein [Woeseia sp.]